MAAVPLIFKIGAAIAVGSALDKSASGDAFEGIDAADQELDGLRWDNVRRLGFAICASTYRASQGARHGFRKAWDKLGDLGVLRGAYHFWRPSDTPRLDAMAFRRDVADLRPGVDMPPIIDIEFSETGGAPELATLGRAETTKRIGDLWAWVSDLFGCYPIIYTGGHAWKEQLGDPLFPRGDMAESPLWIARYYTSRAKTPPDLDGRVPRAWGHGNYWIHQYRGDAADTPFSVKRVDLNRLNTNDATGARAEWIARRVARYGGTVAAFQAAHGLVPDGVVWPRTFARLAWERP